MTWQDAVFVAVAVAILLALMWYLAGRFWKKVQDTLTQYCKNFSVSVESSEDNFFKQFNNALSQIKNELTALQTRQSHLEKQYQSLVNNYFSQLEKETPGLAGGEENPPAEAVELRHGLVPEPGGPQVGVPGSPETALGASPFPPPQPEPEETHPSPTMEPEATLFPTVAPRRHAASESEEDTPRDKPLKQLYLLLFQKGEEAKQLYVTIRQLPNNSPLPEKLQVINRLFRVLDSEEQKREKVHLVQWCTTLFDLNIAYPVPGDKPSGGDKMKYIKKDLVTDSSIFKKADDYYCKISGATEGVVLFVSKPSVTDEHGTLFQEGEVIIS